jgi:MFS transporter, OFA family, oxalate/formate antiporter
LIGRPSLSIWARFSVRPNNGQGPPELARAIYYGWIVLGACLIIGTLSAGIRFSFGVFFKSIEADFGLNRAETSGVMSFYMLICCIASLLGGWVLDRYGPRKLLTLCGLFTVVGLVLSGLVNSLWQLYLTYSLLMAIGTGSINSVLMATTSRWFPHKRGLTMGIVSSSTSIGMMVVAPVASLLISAWGWQTAYLIMGLASAILWIPGSLIVRSESASTSHRLQPSEVAEKADGKQSRYQEPVGLSFVQAIKTRNYWFFFGVWSCGGFSIFNMLTHVVPRAQDVGLTSTQAAFVISIIGGTSLAARVVIGKIADFGGRKQISAICTLIMSAGMLGMVWASSPWMFNIYALVWGIGFGGVVPATNAFLVEIFGTRHIGIILGSLDTGFALGSALGPAFAGYMFDTTGSYVSAFLTASVVMFLSVGFILLLRRPVVKTRTV